MKRMKEIWLEKSFEVVHSDPPTAPSPSEEALITGLLTVLRCEIVHRSFFSRADVSEGAPSPGGFSRVQPEDLHRKDLHTATPSGSGETSAFSRSLEIKHNAHQAQSALI